MHYKYKNNIDFNNSRKVYDFMRLDNIAFIISTFFLIASILVISIRGFNLGIDFAGGVTIELTTDHNINPTKIREALEKIGLRNPIVQNFGSSKDIIIKIIPKNNISNQESIKKILNIIYLETGENTIINRTSFIGPSIGIDLIRSGILSLLVALFSILLYIGFRFKWRLAAGVVISLFHDILITLGMISLLHIEIDSTIIASLMSVIGYSLNDSIVVSDRIRENFKKINQDRAYYIFNLSLTQTFNRTIMTSVTTLFIVLTLLIFGGEMMHGFSITLLIGLFVGTLSSIYVASAIALRLGMTQNIYIKDKQKI